MSGTGVFEMQTAAYSVPVLLPTPPPTKALPLSKKLLASRPFILATLCTAASLLLLGVFYKVSNHHTERVLAHLAMQHSQRQHQIVGYQEVMREAEDDGVSMLASTHSRSEEEEEEGPPAV